MTLITVKMPFSRERQREKWSNENLYLIHFDFKIRKKIICFNTKYIHISFCSIEFMSKQMIRKR